MSDNSQFDPERTLATEQSAAGGRRGLKAGDIVGGNYKIKSIIGRGGMGVVYLAEHLVIQRDFALKALAPERAREADWRRFQTEGKAIAKLDHLNIVKVYDMGTDGPDCLYYVMDLLQGESLEEVIKRQGILETKMALEIFSQLCAGLGYAHKLGLVHRDVKPSNIFLVRGEPGSPAPLVKIIDYGLVKLVGEANQIKQSQTATGQVCGSPLYMSPEQCMGGKIDERSDIYSLGCTLFECLTGKPPFHGNNALETAFMHDNEVPPRLNDLRPDKKYPENLEQMIGRLLQKIPAQRYQSMEQVGQDLERVKHGKSVSREAIHKEGKLFEFDQNGPLSDGKLRPPIALIYLIGTIVSTVIVWYGLSVWGSVSRTNNQPEKRSAEVMAPLFFSKDGAASRKKSSLTAQDLSVCQLFDKWPQISNGVVQQNGVNVRVFTFPDEPVGFISWADRTLHHQLARGQITVPASSAVTLQLPRPEGLRARQFPKILSRIGPEDIYSLEVKEPELQLEGDVFLSEISAELVHSISKWTALRKLDFYHATLKKEATLAFNELNNINELRLRDSFIEGADLAQVKWLKRLKYLDVKNIAQVDPVLHLLAGSTALEKLFIDATNPSKEALLGLTTCPNLKTLSLADALIDDDKLAIICRIPNLEDLSIPRCRVTAQYFALLRQLRKLKTICVGSRAPADLARLKAILPYCSISAGRHGTMDLKGF